MKLVSITTVLPTSTQKDRPCTRGFTRTDQPHRNHPYLTTINIPFIATLVLYLSMTLFRKLRLNRTRQPISDLASHTSHPPKTRRLRSAPTTHFH